MKRLALIIMLSAFVCIGARADVYTGTVKYDSRSEKSGSEQYRYSQSQLEEWAKNPHINSKWRSVIREEPDYGQYNKLKNDTITKYQKAAEKKLLWAHYIDGLLKRVGKNIADDTDREVITAIANNPSVQKDRDAILKDLAKGKISKKCKKYLVKYYSDCVLSYETSRKDAEYIRSNWDSFFRIKGRKVPAMTMQTYIDTVSNPYYYKRMYLALRENEYDCPNIFKKLIYYLPMEGWEWCDPRDNSDREVVEESYPHDVTYNKYNSHPQYRIIDNMAFDSNGNLVRIITLSPDEINALTSNFNEAVDGSIAQQMCVLAYKNNDYDIQSKGQKINHYIKTQLGLEKLTKAEIDKQNKTAQAIANAFIGSARDELRYGKHSRKGRAAQNKHAATFLGALMNAGGNYYSSDGAAWMTQVRNDYKKYFIDQPPYKCERLNDTSFKITYADKLANPTYEVTYTFIQTAPYKVSINPTVKKASDNKTDEAKNNLVSCIKPTEENNTDSPNVRIFSTSEERDIDENVYTSVEQMPQYPGGDAALLDDIAKNMRYPSAAQENGIEGRVVVQFVVTKTGSVGDVKIVRGKDPDLDKEAKRVVKTVKKFFPGIMNGKAVNCWYTIPVTFRLQK